MVVFMNEAYMRVRGIAEGDEQSAMAGLAVGEAVGATKRRKPSKSQVGDRQVVVLGSGNLGLVYVMSERRRLTTGPPLA